MKIVVESEDFTGAQVNNVHHCIVAKALRRLNPDKDIIVSSVGCQIGIERFKMCGRAQSIISKFDWSPTQ